MSFVCIDFMFSRLIYKTGYKTSLSKADNRLAGARADGTTDVSMLIVETRFKDK